MFRKKPQETRRKNSATIYIPIPKRKSEDTATVKNVMMI